MGTRTTAEDDSKAGFSISKAEMKGMSTGATPDYSKAVPFTKVFNHAAFVKQYPTLANKLNVVFFEDDRPNSKDIGGHIQRTKQGTATIALNIKYDGSDATPTEAANLREILLHETQHGIQGFDGRGGGLEKGVRGADLNQIRQNLAAGNIKIYIPNPKQKGGTILFSYKEHSLAKLNDLADVLYRSHYEEIEARAAMKGNDMQGQMDNLGEDFYWVEDIANPANIQLKQKAL